MGGSWTVVLTPPSGTNVRSRPPVAGWWGGAASATVVEMPPLLSLPRVRFTLRPRHEALEQPEPVAAVRARIVFSRAEAERLSVDLDRRSGLAAAPGACTPDHLRRAIAGRLELDGRDATVEVVRLPAGLTAPEAWQVDLDGVDPSTVTELELAAGRARRTDPDAWLEPDDVD